MVSDRGFGPGGRFNPRTKCPMPVRDHFATKRVSKGMAIQLRNPLWIAPNWL